MTRPATRAYRHGGRARPALRRQRARGDGAGRGCGASTAPAAPAATAGSGDATAADPRQRLRDARQNLAAAQQQVRDAARQAREETVAAPPRRGSGVAEPGRAAARSTAAGPGHQRDGHASARLGRDGTLDLRNVSGDVTIAGGEGDDVKVEAVKRVWHADDATAVLLLASIEVEVTERPGAVNVRTRYPRERLANRIATSMASWTTP